MPGAIAQPQFSASLPERMEDAMRLPRRLLLAAPVFTATSHAQPAWPARSLRIIIP